MLGETIGSGTYAKVRFARHETTYVNIPDMVGED